MKKNCVPSIKIKGNISNNIDGVFNKVRKKGVNKFESVFLKKFVSSIKFIIDTKIKKTPNIKKIFFVNFFNKYIL